MALLGVIRAAERLGFTLDEVADLLDTGRRHPTSDLQQRARAKPLEVDRRIADLQTIRAALVEVIDARCDSLTACSYPSFTLPFAGSPSPTPSTDPSRTALGRSCEGDP